MITIKITERACRALLKQLEQAIDQLRDGYPPMLSIADLALMEAVVDDTEMPLHQRIEYNRVIQFLMGED